MNQPLQGKTITSLLQGINAEADENKLYVLTGTINLYMEAIRRCHGRVLFNTGDILTILDMAHTMIVSQPKPVMLEPATKENRELSQTEADMVEGGVVAAMRRG